MRPRIDTERGDDAPAAAEDQADPASPPAGTHAAEPVGSGAGVVRSWLRHGSRQAAADPRRRAGQHAQARRALTGAAAAGQTHPAWQGFVSALHRHTIDAGLAQLQQHERQLLTLAFLEGHSNSELASMLGVSVRTVRRRLSQALGKLDEYVSRVGIWIAALLLFALAAVGGPAGRLARLGAIRSPVAVAWVGGGIATALVVGVLVLSPPTPQVRASSAPSSAQAIRFVPHAVGGLAGTPAGSTASDGTGKGTNAAGTSSTSGGATSGSDRHGCGGNPTDAAPPVPVGPRDGTGSPVTHPGKGGCGTGQANGLNH